MPEISFVIPVYKPLEKWLKKCIASLLDQGLLPEQYELIFVLDGPDQEAKGTIRRMMSKAKCAWTLEEIEHGGAPKARNFGFTKATADILCFWDCDCIIEPGAAQVWLDEFKAQPEVGFVYGSYRFEDSNAAIEAEIFDPWLLKINNYISTCFPIRRQHFKGFDENLESLQDWDMWLTAVEGGAKGVKIDGYAFSTALPSGESISAKGCTHGEWLKRLNAVKDKHGIPHNPICVTSYGYKGVGIRLAKLINADYRDFPNNKPHEYKTIITVGVNLSPDHADAAFSNFTNKDCKNIIFWMGPDVDNAYNFVSRKALYEYSKRINSLIKLQFVEDQFAKRIMERCGFTCEVLPIPIVDDEKALEMPQEPTFCLDVSQEYDRVFKVIVGALPDVKIITAQEVQSVRDLTGIIHFKRAETSLTDRVKRMLVNGRHVLSNIQQPFTGYITDNQAADLFIPKMVNKIRQISKVAPSPEVSRFWMEQLNKSKLEKILNA